MAEGIVKNERIFLHAHPQTCPERAIGRLSLIVKLKKNEWQPQHLLHHYEMREQAKGIEAML